MVKDTVLISAGFSKTTAAIANLGYKTTEHELSEFQKKWMVD